MSRYYGIDLGKTKFKVAVLNECGEDAHIMTYSINALGAFINRVQKDDYVVVEATTNAFWFVEKIKPYVKECYVVDPFKFSIISLSKKKTDTVDAVKLAKRLRYYIQYDRSQDEFPTVFIPPIEVQELRSLFTTYQTIKKEKNITKNRIRSLLTQNGFIGFEKKDLSYIKTQQDILSLPLSEALRAQLQVLFILLRTQLESLESIKETILQKGILFKREVYILTSIKGISPFIALAIMADAVTIDRFRNAKHFCSYMRATPRIDASGNMTKIGRINKQSRHLAMSLLMECINHFRNADPVIEHFYVKKSRGKSKGKVRVAVIRKMLVIIYKMLSTGTLYDYCDEKNHNRKIKEYENIIEKVA